MLELEQRVHANEYDVDAWTDLLRAASGHEAVYKTYESFLLVFPTAVGFPGLNGAERQREACVCVCLRVQTVGSGWPARGASLSCGHLSATSHAAVNVWLL